MNLIRRFVKKLVVTLLLNQFCEIEVSARGGGYLIIRGGGYGSPNSSRDRAATSAHDEAGGSAKATSKTSL